MSLASWFESLAVASRPLQRRPAKTNLVYALSPSERSMLTEKFAIARTRSPARETRALPEFPRSQVTE